MLLSTSATLLARGATLLTATVSVPLTLGYLGKEEFGIWMTITSAYAFLTFADLGLGSGVLNSVAEANSKNDRRAAQQAVSTAVTLLAFLAVALLVAFEVCAYASLHAPRHWFSLRIGPALDSTAQILVVCLALSLPTSLAKRVQLAFQEGHLVSLWDMTAGLISFVALVLAVKLRAGIAGLTLAVFGTTTAVLLVNFGVQFYWRRPWIKPVLALFQWLTARRLLHTGAFFLLLQMLAFLHTSADNLLIAHYRGAGAVAAYAVVQKIALVLLIVPQAVATPLWAAFSDAIARGDTPWAVRSLGRSLMFMGSYGVLCGALLPIGGNLLMRLWLHGRIDPSLSLLAGFGLFVFSQAVALPLSSLASTSGLLRWNVAFSSLSIVSAFVLKNLVLAVGLTSGPIWVTGICQLTLYVVPLSALLWRRGFVTNPYFGLGRLVTAI